MRRLRGFFGAVSEMKKLFFLVGLSAGVMAADDEVVVIYGRVCPIEIIEPMALLIRDCIDGDSKKPGWTEECFHIGLDYFCDDGYGAQALRSGDDAGD